MVDYLTYTQNVGHRGVFVMFGKQHGVVVYLAVLLAVTLAWAGLASAQQQTTSAPAVSPLVWTQIKSDTQKLFQMTSEFKDHVEQTNLTSTLPLPLIKEAHQIEKLAKQIQEHMKNA